jgi:hypothetical protein
VHIGFWTEDPRERDHLKESGINRRLILKRIFEKWDREIWTELIWVRRATGGRVLVNAVMNLGIP